MNSNKIKLCLIIFILIAGCVEKSIPQNCKMKNTIEQVCNLRIERVTTQSIETGPMKGAFACEYHVKMDEIKPSSFYISIQSNSDRNSFESFIKGYEEYRKGWPTSAPKLVRTDDIGEISYKGQNIPLVIFFKQNTSVQLSVIDNANVMGICNNSDKITEIAKIIEKRI